MSSNSTARLVIVAVECALGCRAIPVPGGWFALVDECDFDPLGRYLWHLSTNGYAVRNARKSGKRHHLPMHVEIMNPSPGMVVDHINHNKLDNRRANLRICQQGDNNKNLPLRRDNTTGFKGVYRRGQRWRAQLTDGGRHHFLGCFDTPEEAARAYDTAARLHFGEFAHLNFPEASYG